MLSYVPLIRQDSQIWNVFDHLWAESELRHNYKQEKKNNWLAVNQWNVFILAILNVTALLENYWGIYILHPLKFYI